MKNKGYIYLAGTLCFLLITTQCKLKHNKVMEYAAAVMGNNSGPQLSTSSGGNVPYNPTDSDTAQLPTDFGTSGVEAYVFLSDYSNVNRYKSIEVRFSKNMDKDSVEAAFTFGNPTANTAADTGPASCGSGKAGNPCGSFHWQSARRLTFDPYIALDSNSTFNISLSSLAKTNNDEPLKEYSQDFRTEHDFLLSNKVRVNGESGITNLNGTDDITFDKTQGSLLLTTTFANPSNDLLVTKIDLKKLGETTAHTICDSNCNMTSLGINELNLNNLTTALRPSDGGNTYYYELTTEPINKVYKRYFAFNYGLVKTNPDGLIMNAASTIFDEAMGLPIIGAIINRFLKNDYRLKFNDQFMSFMEFLNKDKVSLNGSFPRYNGSKYCIPPYKDNDYGMSGYSNALSSYSPKSILRNFGDALLVGDTSTGYQDGYCGASGVSGAFEADVTLVGDTDIDIYVKDIDMAPTIGSAAGTYAEFKPSADNDLDIRFKSRDLRFRLFVLARVQNGSAADFWLNRTKMSMNADSGFTVDDYTTSRAHSKLTVDSSGDVNININKPFYGNTNTYPGNSNNNETHNFYFSEYASKLMEGDNTQAALESSSSGIVNLGNAFLPALIAAISDPLISKVLPDVTEGVLRSFNEVVSPLIMNAIIGALRDDGITVELPDYLPEPLAHFPLNVKIKMGESTSPASDPLVRKNGGNSGLVFNSHIAIGKSTDNGVWTPPPGGTRSHGKVAGMLMTKDENDTSKIVSEKSKAFAKTSTNPGILLQLRADMITQAAYQLWKHRVLDLTINKKFLDTIKAFSGSGPLLELTSDLVTAEPILSIMAPGRSSISVWNGTKLIKIYPTDLVDMNVSPVMAPSIQMIPVQSGSGLPKLRAYLTDMQLNIKGWRCKVNDPDEATYNAANPVNDPWADARCDGENERIYYAIATSRISLNGTARFGFVPFDNKNNNPDMNNLSAIHVEIDNDDSLIFSVDVLEGTQNNPLGLDPEVVHNILDPLVKALVVPLVNNILNQIPLPDKVPLSSVVSNNSTTPCTINFSNNALELATVNSDAGDEFILGVGQLKGAYATDPGSLVNCE